MTSTWKALSVLLGLLLAFSLVSARLGQSHANKTADVSLAGVTGTDGPSAIDATASTSAQVSTREVEPNLNVYVPKAREKVIRSISLLSDALLSGDVAALSKLFVTNARVDPPDEDPIVGKGPAFTSFLEKWIADVNGTRVFFKLDGLLQMKGKERKHLRRREVYLVFTPVLISSSSEDGENEGKGIIVWEYIFEGNLNSAPKNGRTLIRWFVWNSNSLTTTTLRASAANKQPPLAGPNDPPVEARVRSALTARWSDFNKAIKAGSFRGIMDFATAKTVVFPPGVPPLRGLKDFELLANAWAAANVTQPARIDEAFLLRGTYGDDDEDGNKAYFILEHTTFVVLDSSNVPQQYGKQIILWEVQRRYDNEDEDQLVGDSPLTPGRSTLKWVTVCYNNSPDPEVTMGSKFVM